MSSVKQFEKGTIFPAQEPCQGQSDHNRQHYNKDDYDLLQQPQTVKCKDDLSMWALHSFVLHLDQVDASIAFGNVAVNIRILVKLVSGLLQE